MDNMSYQEKQTTASLITSVLVTTVYSVLMYQRYPDGSAYSKEVFSFWGAFILILIPVSVVARIIIFILLNIVYTVATQEETPPVVDERDQLIELKATHISLYVFSIGLVLGMALLVLELPPAAMFITLICSGLLSEMVGEIAQLYFYRRGV